MKKILAILLSLALVFAFVACGGSNEEPAPADDGEAAEEPAAEEQSYELVLGGVTPDPAKAGETKFVELIEEYSNGTVTCKDFPDNSLGDDLARLEMCINGECDIAIGASANYTSILKNFYLFDIYFFFLNKQEVYDVGFAGEAAKAMQDSAESAGVKVVSMWENGFRDLTTNNTEVHSPADLKGLKIRTMENEIHLAAWKALGANPTPMTFSEVFTAMQQGTIDGQENPMALMVSNSFQEVEKFCVKSEHVYSPFIVVMNLNLFNQMSEAQQEAVMKAMADTQKYHLDECASFEEYAEGEFEKAGSTVITLTDEEKVAFQDAVASADCESMAKELMPNPEIVDNMKAELEAYRG